MMEVDDVLIIRGKMVEEAVDRSRQFLLSCCQHNIKLARRKLQFDTTVDFAGMRMGGKDGYKLTPAKAESISELKARQNISEVFSHLGLLNRFGNYIPDLTKIVPHIQELLKKDIAFMWTMDCQCEMDEVHWGSNPSKKIEVQSRMLILVVLAWDLC